MRRFHRVRIVSRLLCAPNPLSSIVLPYAEVVFFLRFSFLFTRRASIMSCLACLIASRAAAMDSSKSNRGMMRRWWSRDSFATAVLAVACSPLSPGGVSAASCSPSSLCVVVKSMGVVVFVLSCKQLRDCLRIHFLTTLFNFLVVFNVGVDHIAWCFPYNWIVLFHC